MGINNQNTIFIISNNFWNLYNYRELLIKDLSKKNNVILLAKKDSFKNKFSNKKFDINFDNSLNIFRHLINLIKIYFLINKFKPKIILNFTIFPMIYIGLISKFNRCYSINTLTGLGKVFTKGYFLSKFFKIFIKFFVIDKESTYCFQNKVDEKYFRLKFNTLRTYVVQGSGINLKIYNKYNNILPAIHYTTFFMAARDIKSKGINEFIESGFKCIDLGLKVKIIFIGDINSLSKGIKQKVDNLIYSKKMLHFQFVNKDQLIKLIKRSDIVVLPSYYREGCPHILLEAMACGKPIITTVKKHSSQLVEDGVNGYKVGIRNTEQLIKIFIKFINLDDRVKSIMGANSTRIVDKYKIENLINNYNHIISKNTGDYNDK